MEFKEPFEKDICITSVAQLGGVFEAIERLEFAATEMVLVVVFFYVLNCALIDNGEVRFRIHYVEGLEKIKCNSLLPSYESHLIPTLYLPYKAKENFT